MGTKLAKLQKFRPYKSKNENLESFIIFNKKVLERNKPYLSEKDLEKSKKIAEGIIVRALSGR